MPVPLICNISEVLHSTREPRFPIQPLSELSVPASLPALILICELLLMLTKLCVCSFKYKKIEARSAQHKVHAIKELCVCSMGRSKELYVCSIG